MRRWLAWVLADGLGLGLGLGLEGRGLEGGWKGAGRD